MPIAEFFERHGEDEFRRREAEVAGTALEGADGGAIALGGGAVLSERVREALGPPPGRVARLRRPLEAGMGSERPLAQDGRFAARSRERRAVSRRARRRRSTDAPERIARMRCPLAPTARCGRAALGPSARAATRRSSRSAIGLSPAAGRFLVTDSNVAAPARRRRLRRGGAGRGPARGGVRRRWPRPSACCGSWRAGADALRPRGSRWAAGSSATWPGSAPPPTSAGCRWSRLPTTLVAQVDSAYGGKTGVDLPEAKNYVGRLPHAGRRDRGHGTPCARCRTRSFAAGFVEVLKTALLAGGGLWERVRALRTIDPAGARRRRSSPAPDTRSTVVADDERDAGRAPGPEPRAHGRPRDRGRIRLRALPPRRGGRAGAAGGAAPLRRGRAARRGRGPSSAGTACPPRSTRRSTPSAVLAARRSATRSGPPRASASSCLQRPGRADGRAAGRRG